MPGIQIPGADASKPGCAHSAPMLDIGAAGSVTQMVHPTPRLRPRVPAVTPADQFDKMPEPHTPTTLVVVASVM